LSYKNKLVNIQSHITPDALYVAMTTMYVGIFIV